MAIVIGNPGSNSSGTSYYPLITPSSNTTLYWTMGCDNVGGIQYGIVPSAASPPTAVTNWVNMAQGVGFPGVNYWPVLGTFAPRTYMWFKCDMQDLGRVFGYTFAISTTPSMAGILTHSRMLTGYPGKPYYRG
jgi:hypothetical protein